MVGYQLSARRSLGVDDAITLTRIGIPPPASAKPHLRTRSVVAFGALGSLIHQDGRRDIIQSRSGAVEHEHLSVGSSTRTNPGDDLP